MSSEYNKLEDELRTTDIKKISTKKLIRFLYLNTKNDEIKEYNEKKIEDYFLKINYSFFYENIFTNTQNYSTVSMYIIALLIPFYINYPRFYNLGGFGFFIGLSGFLGLYYFINTTFGVFFPSASRLFLILSILFYGIFFLLMNKLNHVSLFFISCIVSFVVINYIYRIVLTSPSKKNTFNNFYIEYNNDQTNKKYIEFNYIIKNVCNEIIERFKLKLPSGRMLYSYLTVFKITSNKNKWSGFLSNLFSPLLSIFYLSYLGNYLTTIKNNSYKNIDLNVLPIIGVTDKSKSYVDCQANYVLPIEFNFNLFLNQYYTEKKLDDNTYQHFVKALKRISSDLLNIYQPKFSKVPFNSQNISDHISYNKEIKTNNNHILNQIKKLLHSYNIDFNNNNTSNGDYIDKLLNIINNPEIPYKSQKEALNLMMKINQTLRVQTKDEPNNKGKITEDVRLAIEVLLEDTQINAEYKPLLKDLCEKYASHMKKNLQNEKLYGFNYNLWTYPIFNNEVVQKSNDWFYWLLKLLSCYVLFGRPITSPWLMTTLLVLTSSNFSFYVKDMASNSSWMKYLGMGLDNQYFEESFDGLEKNNTTVNKSIRTLTKIILYLFIALPFLQFYNNVFYGMTFNPLYYNIIYQFIFIVHILFCFIKEPFGLHIMIFNILYFIVALIILSLTYYFIK